MMVNKWRAVVCNLCGSEDAATVYPDTLEEKPGPDSYAITAHRVGCHPRLVRCLRCNLIYANPQPAGLETFYGTWQGDELYQTETAARLQTFDRLLGQLEKHVAVGRLLDVGCATGLLLVAARSRGWQVKGIEASAWAVQQAVQVHGLQVFAGVLADASLSPGEFDAIMMVDVIEHLGDPAKDLTRVYHALRPGGALLVTTPDVASVPSRLLGERWWAVIPTHLYYFGGDTLSGLLERIGFRVLELGHADRSFSLDYWGSKLTAYNGWLGQTMQRVLQGTGLHRRHLRLNLHDQILAIARKEG